jgi:hypothetical protein
LFFDESTRKKGVFGILTPAKKGSRLILGASKTAIANCYTRRMKSEKNAPVMRDKNFQYFNVVAAPPCENCDRDECFSFQKSVKRRQLRYDFQNMRRTLVLCRSSVLEFGSGRILQIRPKFGSAEFRERNPAIFWTTEKV